MAGVVLLPNREPVLLAKQIATVDHFSRGRLDLGRFRGQDGESLRRQHWIGPVEEVAETLVCLSGAGVGRVVAMHTATDTYPEMLGQAQRFAEEVMPRVPQA